MFTDWILVRRLAQELAAQTVGSRVTALAHLADGRVGLEIWRRGTTRAIAFDLFSPAPVATLEAAEVALESERGFIRAAGAALRGLVLKNVRSTIGERVVAFDFATRSRFGVTTAYVLVAELVPKFGNLILLKGDTVVAAYKEFKPRTPSGRATIAGAAYTSPPLDLRPKADQEELAAALTPQLASDAIDSAAIKALRACRPTLPYLLAESVLAQPAWQESATPSERARSLLREADKVLRSIESASPTDELIVYRRDGTLVQAHLVPLHQYEELERSAEEALLPLLVELRRDSRASQQLNRTVQRRAALKKTLDELERKVRAEITAAEQRLAALSGRDELRVQGESIFATLHEVNESARADAKARAAALFARYKRLSGSVRPLERRLASLRQKREDLEQLVWELERAADGDLNDVARAIQHSTGRRSPQAPVPLRRRKRPRLAFETPGGSRIFVGRSPVENAELTFEVARPNDLWFHAQRVPGAHVILQRDDKAPPPVGDIELAAGLAAHFSKAQLSPKVTVDYTLRKHVRKRPAASPGLVFYTNPKSVLVAPQAPAEVPML